MPLALPEHVYENYERWDGAEVSIVGTAFAHQLAEEVIFYDLKGRNVTGSICTGSPLVVFVESLKRL